MYTYHNYLRYKFFGYHLITCDSFILPKGKKERKKKKEKRKKNQVQIQIQIQIQPNRMKVAFKTRVKV
jgi:hypothetical protein